MVGDAAVVGKTRHFALASEFACSFQPAIESSGRNRYYLKPVEKNSAGAFCLIVGVDALQFFVEYVGKCLDVALRLGIPLYEPLVTAFVSVAGVNRGSGIVSRRGSATPARRSKGRVGVPLPRQRR